ncbi:MAG: hypothetical protein AB8D52_12420 [Gammaproteobacteria bacterium]
MLLISPFSQVCAQTVGGYSIFSRVTTVDFIPIVGVPNPYLCDGADANRCVNSGISPYVGSYLLGFGNRPSASPTAPAPTPTTGGDISVITTDTNTGNNGGAVLGGGSGNGDLPTNPPSSAPVPLPAAAWLFGSALMGLFASGKRNKSS